jgi:hypothetical protein
VADERERDKRLQGQSDLEDAAAEEEEWWAAEVDAMVRSLVQVLMILDFVPAKTSN